MRDPTPQPTNIDFRSKIDLWLVGAILLVPVFILEFIAGDGGVNEYRVDLLTWLIVIIVVGGIGGAIWVLLPLLVSQPPTQCPRTGRRSREPCSTR